MLLFSLAVSSLMNVIVLLYMCEILSSSKIKWFSSKSIITIVLMTTYWCASYVITNSIFRILISFLILIVACLIMFKKTTNKSVIISFVAMIILLISEILYVLLNVIIFKFDETGIQNNVFGTFLTNVLIISIALVVLKLINKNNMINKLIEKLSEKSKNPNLYIFFMSFTTIIMLIL